MPRKRKSRQENFSNNSLEIEPENEIISENESLNEISIIKSTPDRACKKQKTSEYGSYL